MQTPPSLPGTALQPALIRGVCAAAVVGLLDGMRVILTDTLPVAVGRTMALLAFDALAMAALVVVPLVLGLWLAGRRRSLTGHCVGMWLEPAGHLG